MPVVCLRDVMEITQLRFFRLAVCGHGKVPARGVREVLVDALVR